MKKTIAAATALILLLTAGCAKGGASAEEKQSCTVLAMDTVMELTAYGDKAESALVSAQNLIKSLDSKLSITNPGSETNQINSSGGQSVKVSADTMALVKSAVEYGAMTGGALDISITPVYEAWGFLSGDYRVPSESELAGLLKKVDYTKISYDEQAGTVTVPEGMEISFGTNAKGYAGDLVVAQMAAEGVTSAIVNLGGNVQALGAKPDGTAWNVGIQDPFGGDYFGAVKVIDKGVTTAGGYERYFTGDDGTVYWHIFDPETGYPAKSGLVSVTVVSDSGTLADNLDTALFVMGLDESINFWRTYGGFDMVLVTEDDEVYITSGIKDSFTLADGYKDLTLTVIE